METGLALKGNAELGKKLVERAVEEHRDQVSKTVVGFVQEILAYIEIQKAEEARCQQNIVVLEAKIEALEKGEFSVDRRGNITFADKKLQEAAVEGNDNCPNCGMGRSGVRPGVRFSK